MAWLDKEEIEYCKRLGVQYAEECIEETLRRLQVGDRDRSRADFIDQIFWDYGGFSEAATHTLVKAGLLPVYSGRSAAFDHEQLLSYKLFEQEFTSRTLALISERARTYLEVPFPEKDEASHLGASWDRERRKWYAHPAKALKPFERWMPRRSAAPESQPTQTMRPVSAPTPANPERIELFIDLIPSTAWFSNLRSEVAPEEWARIKTATFRPAKYLCQACGGKGEKHPVECHERWSFDERTRTQRLVCTVSLCPACHEATHFGLARVRGRDQIARQHLMRVNEWTEPQVNDHIARSMRVWKERSQTQWVMDARWLLDFVPLTDTTKEKILGHAQGLEQRAVNCQQSMVIRNEGRDEFKGVLKHLLG